MPVLEPPGQARRHRHSAGSPHSPAKAKPTGVNGKEGAGPQGGAAGACRVPLQVTSLKPRDFRVDARPHWQALPLGAGGRPIHRCPISERGPLPRQRPNQPGLGPSGDNPARGKGVAPFRELCRESVTQSRNRKFLFLNRNFQPV